MVTKKELINDIKILVSKHKGLLRSEYKTKVAIREKWRKKFQQEN